MTDSANEWAVDGPYNHKQWAMFWRLYSKHKLLGLLYNGIICKEYWHKLKGKYYSWKMSRWGFWLSQWRIEGRGFRILLIGRSGTICRRFGD